MSQTSPQQLSETTKLRGPGKYNVIMLNDDSTPMDFVINVLTGIFSHTADSAKVVMLEVHEKGRSIAGNYSYEVAEQKCIETITDARRNAFPLDVTIEKVD